MNILTFLFLAGFACFAGWAVIRLEDDKHPPAW